MQRQRLQLTMPVTEWLRQAEALTAVRFAPVDDRIAVRSVLLPPPLHFDPADRIIIATALHLQATLITTDRTLRDYPHVEARWSRVHPPQLRSRRRAPPAAGSSSTSSASSTSAPRSRSAPRRRAA